MTGFIWGNVKEDWLVTYSGGGQCGQDPISINGKALWKYDTQSSDQTALDFDNIVKVGQHSWWGWLKGAEIVVGGGFGFVGGVLVAPAPPAAIVVGIVGAIGTAAALVDLSNTAKELVVSDQPQAPKESPKAPPVPKQGDKILPRRDTIIIAISSETVTATADENISLSGSFKGTEGTGFLSSR
jgi:hypothetical protein